MEQGLAQGLEQGLSQGISLIKDNLEEGKDKKILAKLAFFIDRRRRPILICITI